MGGAKTVNAKVRNAQKTRKTNEKASGNVIAYFLLNIGSKFVHLNHLNASQKKAPKIIRLNIKRVICDV